MLASPWLRDRYGDAVGKSQQIIDRPNDEWVILRQAVFEYPWNHIGRVELKAIIVAWREFGLSGNTIQRGTTAVRRVMKICTKAEYRGTRWEMSKDDYAEATDPDGLPRIKIETGTVGRRLSDEEIADLFAVCDWRQDGWEDAKPEYPANAARDKAFFALLFFRGMRVSEVVNLKMKDYNRRTGKIQILKSKSGNRTIKVSGQSKIYLDKWLDFRLEVDPRPHDGPIFYRVNRLGRVEPFVRRYDVMECPGPFDQKTSQRIGCGFDFKAYEDRLYEIRKDRRNKRECEDCGTARPYRQENRGLTTQAVSSFLAKRCDMANIERATTHDGRRTCISWLLEGGALPAAQALAGHTDPSQTLSYQRYNPAQHREATEALDKRQAEALGLDGDDPEAEPE